MKLKSSSYAQLKTYNERLDFLADYFARNCHAINIRRGDKQLVLPDCTFDRYQVDPDNANQVKALKVCKRFAERLAHRVITGENGGVGLYMAGETGCGKTHLAMAILNSVRKTFPGYYIPASELFPFLRRKDDGDNTQAKRLENLCAVSVLVIDEIGRSSVSDFERIMLRDLVERRAMADLPTILVTNLDAEEAAEALDKTFISRLYKLAYPLIFDWEDYRRRASLAQMSAEEVF